MRTDQLKFVAATIGRHTTLGLALAFTTAVYSQSAPQPVIEEVIVYGDLREQSLDRLPASVSVLNGESLERRGARHLDEVLAMSANVNIASGGARSRFFQIRGIGETGQFAEPLNPSVGVIVDGVDISNSASVAALIDVDQVEVFRGPQGTRYGANALAGLINIRTNAPTSTPEFRFGAERGDYNAATVFGIVSGPIRKDLTGRFAIQQYNDDGFISNQFLNRTDTNARDELTMRGKLHWQAAQDLSFAAILAVVDADNAYDAFSLDNDRQTRADQPGLDTQKSHLGTLNTDWSAPTGFNIEATISTVSSDSAYGYDEDWTYIGFHPFGYSSTDYYLRDRTTNTAEIRFISDASSRVFGNTTDWAIGLYRLAGREDLTRLYTFAPGPFTSTYNVDRLALFGQLDIDLSERTSLSVGARVEKHESAYIDSESVRFSPEDRMDGWRLGIDHTVTENINAYVLLSGGYKAGGFNTDGTLDEDLRIYGPETSTSIELGIKGHFKDDRINLQIALFSMQRDDIQIASSIVRTRSDGSAEFIDFVGNAAQGRNNGVETEIEFALRQGTSITASIGLLDTEYRAFVNSVGLDASGREQSHAPRYQYAFSARHLFTGGWYLEGGIEGRDSFYYSNSSDTQSSSYATVNIAAGVTLGNWDLSMWARNIADEDYHTRGFFFGNDPRLDYASRAYTQLAEPRRIAVGLSRSW